MEINGQNFENISFSKAVDILRNNTHLSLTVKTNIFGELSHSICTCTLKHIEQIIFSSYICLSFKIMTDLPFSVYLLPLSLQRASQQDRAWEEEWRPSHSQDPGEKRQSLLHPRPSWRHGVPHRPQGHQENEGQHCVWRTKQDQEDAGEDALQYTATQTVQVRGLILTFCRLYGFRKCSIELTLKFSVKYVSYMTI